MTKSKVLHALECCIAENCPACPLLKNEEGCQGILMKEAYELIDEQQKAFALYGGDEGINEVFEERDRLADENRTMKAELKVNLGNHYWVNICKMNARQESKGMEKYGEPLEENTTLTTTQRIEHAQEEAIDLLKYLEHLKQVVDSDGITANDYQRACLRTAPGDKTEWLENAIYGIIGEAGEIVDLVKKYKWQGHTLNAEDVALELGDLLWYGSLLASAINYDLGTVMQMNEKKLEQRYPAGFSKDRSINRKE